MTDKIRIERGVRQSCVLSLTLVRIYTDNIFISTLTNTDVIKIEREMISNIRYAKDTAMKVKNLEN